MRFQLKVLLASLALSACPAAPAAPAQSTRQALDRYVDAEASTIRSNAMKIWGFAEVGFRETRSSALLQDTLKQAGFKVTAGIAGMPTAFVASFRTGQGPVLAVLAEFDALPGLSQQAATTSPVPLAGAIAAHGCGHNLLGSGAVGAAVAISQWMAASAFKGEVRVYGSPAEEGGDGKAFMVRDGVFKDVDVVIHWHPDVNTGVLASPTLANVKTDFTFTGVASHAAAAPERGRSALAGAEVMDVAVNFMRQFTPDGTRIHNIVTDGGRAANVVPASATLSYYVRSPDVRVLKELQARVIKAAQGAAMATETAVKWEVRGGVYPLLVNTTLATLAQEELAPETGNLARSPEEIQFAQGIQKSMGVAVTVPDTQRVEPLKFDGYSPASSDVGDVSYTVPAVGVLLPAWPQGTPPHSWAAASGSGSEYGLKAAVTAAKVLANLGVRLLMSPEVIKAAKEELAQAQGTNFKYEALFGTIPPALNYRDSVASGR